MGTHGAYAGNGNGRPTGNGLSPELAARLRALAQAMPPADIAELWVFPPLSHVEGSAEFVLFTLFLSDGARRVCGSRATRNGGSRNGNGNGAAPGGAFAEDASSGGVAVMETGVIAQAEGEPAQEVHEYGSVPADRVAGLVERFRRRLGEDAEPRHVVIDGNLSAWKELVEAPDPA